MSDYNDDVLIGMQEICDFTRVGRRTIKRWVRDYQDVPIRNDGQYWADKEALRDWQRRYARNEVAPA